MEVELTAAPPEALLTMARSFCSSVRAKLEAVFGILTTEVAKILRRKLVLACSSGWKVNRRRGREERGVR